jgi:LTXXQ motif family protein
MKQIISPVFAITVLIAGPLMAQSRVEPGMIRPPGSSTPMTRGGSLGCMEKMTDMAQHVEGRIASMQAKLKITDKQMPQWNAAADVMRDNARRMTEMHGMMGQDASLSAPERLARMEKMTAGMMEAVQSTKAAFMPLYSVLSAEQKKEADTLAPAGFGWG